MTEKNELMEQNENTEMEVYSFVRETNDFVIVKNNVTGKFEKRMKYHERWSRQAKDETELVELYKLMNEENENVTPMKKAVGNTIDIEHIFFTPYTGFDEDTGLDLPGIITLLQGRDGKYTVTSSKSVYFKLKNMLDVFSFPDDPNYLGLVVKVIEEKGGKDSKGDPLSLELIGLPKQPKKDVTPK